MIWSKDLICIIDIGAIWSHGKEIEDQTIENVTIEDHYRRSKIIIDIAVTWSNALICIIDIGANWSHGKAIEDQTIKKLTIDDQTILPIARESLIVDRYRLIVDHFADRRSNDITDRTGKWSTIKR